MKKFTSSITILASKAIVFHSISSPEEFSKAIPKILEVEFISTVHKGVGTKFKETREMNGKKSSVVLEVMSYEQDSSIQLISKAGGTTWDSTFNVETIGDETQLKLTMDATPHNIFAKLMTGMISKMLQKALNEDLESIKKYCEQ